MDACWLLGPPVIHLSHTIHKWHKINYEAVAALKKKIENWKLRSKSKTCFDSPRERERGRVTFVCVGGIISWETREWELKRNWFLLWWWNTRKDWREEEVVGLHQKRGRGRGKMKRKERISNTASAPVSVMNHDLPSPPLFLMSFLPAL